jgi:two-component system chemotaxis response regulator CheB
MAVEKKIKVLMVDDLEVAVMAVEHIINQQPDMVLYASAANPYEAVRVISKEKPDVILLDIQMPKMDGLTFLRKIMSQHPIPVVIFSGVAPKNSHNAVKALEYGAVAVLQKPKSLTSPEFLDTKIRFLETLKGAAASASRLRLLRKIPYTATPPYSEQMLAQNKVDESLMIPSRKIIALGASTGGTQAIEYLMRNLKPDIPGMLITQHMPGEFTKAFADRLNTVSLLHIKEAEDGETVKNNCVYIGSGFYHIMLEKKGLEYIVRLKDGPLVNRHKPSVDVLFRSAARHAGAHGVGILLTGMGNDGARGLLEMKEAGAMTIAQDEASSVVFGMPKAAIDIGAAHHIMSLNKILDYLSGFNIHY